MRLGAIVLVLVLSGCGSDPERYADLPPSSARGVAPVVYADERCPPPETLAAYCGGMGSRDSCYMDSRCRWSPEERRCRPVYCRARYRDW